MSKPKRFHGVIVPMITPFTEDGKIDEAATVKVTEHLVKNNASPFVFGTTGESASVPDSFRPGFVQTVVNVVAGRTHVYAGISSNCLTAAVEAAKNYFEIGVDAVVSHLPSYYPLTTRQMLNYFEMLADSVPGPLLLYNIKSTTHMSIPLDVVEKLSHHPNVVGLKDSERDIQRLETAIQMWKDRADFSHLIGWGTQLANALLLGSDGMVPSTGNVVPKLFQELFQAAADDDVETAKKLQRETDEIAKIYQSDRTLGESLAALKVMMRELGLCAPYMLPPLTRLSPEDETQIKKQMAALNLYQSAAVV